MADGTGRGREPTERGPTGSGSSPRAPLPVRRLFSFDFVDDRDFAATIEHIVGVQPDDDLFPVVATPNVDQIVTFHQRRNARLLADGRRARYVLPDGQPIIWTSRLGRAPLAARLTGSSLLPPLWSRLVSDHRRILLVAPSAEVADGMAATCPDLVTYVPPFFDTSDPRATAPVVEDLIDLVRRHRPEFVFIGLAFPKTQVLAMGVIRGLDPGRSDDDATPVPLFLLLGAAFSMYLGLSRRAPAWAQRLGLEWLYRFVLEPRRLFRRYFITDTRFLPMMVREVRRLRRQAH